MKRRCLSLILTLAALCAVLLAGIPLTAGATYDYWADHFRYEYDSSTKTMTVLAMSDPEHRVRNPFTVSKIPWHGFSSVKKIVIADTVKEITPYAFFRLSGLESVDAGAGITKIGESAFESCYNLTAVKLPDGVESIERCAFDSCDKLTDLTLPQALTSIGEHAFCGCDSLTSITFPKHLTSIELSTFSCCAGLAEFQVDPENPVYSSDVCGVLFNKDKTELILAPRNFPYGRYVIPKTVTSIRSSAFFGCARLSDVTVPDGVTSIENWAFSLCANLAKLTLPKGVTSIAEYAFYKCTKLTELALPESVVSIGDSAFRECTALSSVTFPETLTSIGDSAFKECTALSSVTFPETLTSIGANAFDECGLREVTLPKNVASVGANAFLCAHLTAIHVDPENAAFSSDERGLLYNKAQTELIRVPVGASLDGYAIPEGVTSIGADAFRDCVALTELAIPAHVTEIGNRAFSNCSNLRSITLPEGLAEIRNGTFSECVRLTALVLPERVTSIGWSAFGGCFRLTEITIPQSVTSIQGYAFEHCISLQSVYFKGDAPQCDSSVFYNNESVKPDRTVYHLADRSGWPESSWKGCPTALWDGENRPEPSHRHSYTVTVVSPTCEKSGYTTYTCECGSSYQDPNSSVGRLGHDLVIDVPAVPATCTEAGTSAAEHCARCGARYSAWPVKALGHDILLESPVPATCTEGGLTAGSYCSRCDYRIEPEATEALGHDYVDHEAKTATCTEPGWNAYRACTRCADSTYEELPPLGHDYVDHEAKAATCTEPGWNAYQTCSRCNYTSYEELPALGHHYVDGVCACGAVEKLTDENLKFFGKTVTFEADFSIKYYVPKAAVDPYDSVYLRVTKSVYDAEGNVTGTESEIVPSTDYNSGYKAYGFRFAGLSAAEVGSSVDATIYGVKNGKTYEGATQSGYSVKQYCYNTLAKSGTKAAAKRALVDFLNYASAAQIYFNRNVNGLVNADLTAGQAALGTQTAAAINSDRAEGAVTNPRVAVSGCTLIFESKIVMKFVFDPTDYLNDGGSLSDLRVVVRDADGGILRTFLSDEFVNYNAAGTLKSVLFDDLGATEMRKAVIFQVMAGDTAVSNSRTYSIQSYAYSKQTDARQGELMRELIKYGDSMAAWKQS